MGEGKSGSTLGTRSGRTSNVEANEYLRSKKENREKKEADAEKPQEISPADQPYEEVSETLSTSSPSGKPMYEWRDENGTLHISNDLGNVPPEYQDQLFEAQTESSGE